MDSRNPKNPGMPTFAYTRKMKTLITSIILLCFIANVFGQAAFHKTKQINAKDSINMNRFLDSILATRTLTNTKGKDGGRGIANSSLTAGGVLFASTTTVLSDAANFYWDAVQKFQGIGTNSPEFPLDVRAQNGSDNVVRLRGSSSMANFVAIRFDAYNGGTVNTDVQKERMAIGYADSLSNQPGTLGRRAFIEASNFNPGTPPPDFVLQFSGYDGQFYWHRPVFLVKGNDRSFNILKYTTPFGSNGTETTVLSINNSTGQITSAGGLKRSGGSSSEFWSTDGSYSTLPWKFGEAVKTSGVTLKTTQYVELNIGGTLVKLAVVN